MPKLTAAHVWLLGAFADQIVTIFGGLLSASVQSQQGGR